MDIIVDSDSNMPVDMNRKLLQIGDVYALQEKETAKWFAFQIVNLGEENAVYVDLDYWSEQEPTQGDLKSMDHLRLNHHLWNNTVHYCWAPYELFPVSAKLIGNIDIRLLDECKNHGSWPDGSQQKWTESWNELPSEQVMAFKVALARKDETVIIAGKEVKKCLYGVFDDTLSLLSDFSELDKLPGLGRIVTNKEYPQMIPFLERRHLIRELIWNDCKLKEVDLSCTHLEELEISGKDIEIIRLPARTKIITLKGKLSPKLKIISPNDGYFMILRVEMQDDFLPDVGLSRLTTLVLKHIRNFSLKTLTSRFPDLFWLGLTGKPGYIRDVDEITKLHDLETLTLNDLFGFSADEFPQPESLPELKRLWLESIPSDAAKAIKKRYKSNVHDMHVLKPRSDEWLHENLNNPLRHWDGNEFISKSKYSKSLALWKETRRRLLEAVAFSDAYIPSIDRIVIDYVEGFNKLDSRSQFIETEEREDIINAFIQILDEAGICKERNNIMQLIDDNRNW